MQEVDPNGQVTARTYDGSRRLTSIWPGQAHLGIQGNWTGEFGADGYVLCAFSDASGDVAQLPAYVDSIVSGDTGSSYPFTRSNLNSLWSH